MTAGSDRAATDVGTLGEMIGRRAAQHGDDEAIVFPHERCTYAELDDRSDRYAKGLIALGVEAGERVGYLLPEGIDTVAILLGAAKIGAIAVPINSRFKVVELAQVIEHSGMSVLFVARSEAGTDLPGLVDETLAAVAAPELREVIELGDRARFDERAAAVAAEDLRGRQNDVRGDDHAVIMYTSGTTASPKGALLSHHAFVRFAESSLRSHLGIDGAARVWTALPMFHIGGVGFVLGTLYTGGTFVHVGYFDPSVALAQIRDEQCTVALPGFETIWLPVMNHPARRDGDLDSLGIIVVVGVEERLRQMAAGTPGTLVSCYGQTEACGFLSLGDLNDPLDLRISTGGFPLPGMECEVRDPETGERLPAGTTGELWHRGPQTFDGYFRDPELTAALFDDEGFYRTGDIVHMDADGRITFDSRVKDMLKVGGENVSAAEVESHLVTHPAVNIVQVVAAPDEKYVEVPAAFVELEPGATVTEQELIDHCRGKIATFRVPRYVRFVDEWPMSGTKIKKYALREAITNELADAGVTVAPPLRSCVTCELVERRDRGDAPPWDRILRTEMWDVVHAFGTSVEGWLVLALRRHATAVAQLTDREAAELGTLIKRVSLALQDALGCPKTYVAQFAEAADHPHVHVHVIARHADQPDDWKGPGIFFHALGVDETDEVPETRRNEIAAAIAARL